MSVALSKGCVSPKVRGPSLGGDLLLGSGITDAGTARRIQQGEVGVATPVQTTQMIRCQSPQSVETFLCHFGSELGR
jgi:hypothetical protein